MGNLEKRLNRAGLIKAVTWDLEADCSAAGCGITPLNPGAIKLAYPAIEIDEIFGAFETDIDHANFNGIDFGLDFQYQWNGLENILMAMWFGTAAAPTSLFVVDATNNKIDFKEGVPELTGTVATGSYTGATLATAIAAAMNGAAGKALTYTCTYSSSTNKFTIGAGANFTICWNTGTHKATDISTMCGYSDVADDNGGNLSFVSDTASVGAAYQHTMSMADQVSGIFGTYAVEKLSKIHVVPSLKVMKLALTQANGMLKLNAGCRGSKVVDDSSVITSMSAITYAAIRNRAKFSQAVFRMNDQTGAALGSTFVVKPKTFNLDPERKMDNEHASGSATIIEPLETGKPTVKLTMEFPRMDAVNALYFANWIANAEKKADITITGPVIAGTHAYMLKCEMPRLQVEDVEYPDSGLIPSKIVLRAVVADVAPTGMALTNPLTATLINSRSTSLLA
jgi:hypothetical protein